MRSKQLKASIIIGGSVSSAFRAAMTSTEGGLKKIGSAIAAVESRQRQLASGIDFAQKAGRNVAGLRREYVSLEYQVDRMRRAQERLNAAQSRKTKLNAVGGGLQTAGMYASGAGAAVLGAAFYGTREAKNYQTEVARIGALGLGDKVTADAQKYARGLKTYGTSQLENLTLVRDAMSVFGDLHHAQMAAPILAKMKFGNSAFYGAEHGAENEAKFMDMLKVIELRGGTKSKADFELQANMVQKVISATGGRVGPEEWRHLIATGGLAAKSMRNDAFFYQLEPLVQEMGGDRVGTGLMTAYSSLYQGHASKRSVQNMQRLGLIEDKSKVHFDKAGQMAFLNPGALKGAQLFKASQYEWMKTVLLPTLAKKGLTTKDQVLDAIGSIFSSRKGADLMAAMYLQQQQIEKSERLNRGAADINTIDASGRNTTAGKELNAAAKLADAKLRFGTAALPLYTSALDLASGALERFNAFADKHATLVQAGSVALIGIGGALVVLGPILGAAGIALNAYAGLQLLAAQRAAMAATNIGVETEAIVAQGAAARGAAGGLAAFAKRAAITLAVANGIDYAAGKAGVGKNKASDAQDEANWQRMGALRKVWSGGLRGVEHIGRAIGMTNVADQAQADRVKYETEALGGTQKLPAVNAKPAPTTITNNTTNNNTFHITQQPGETPDAFAHRLADMMKQQQGVAQRGSLVDGVH